MKAADVDGLTVVQIRIAAVHGHEGEAAAALERNLGGVVEPPLRRNQVGQLPTDCAHAPFKFDRAYLIIAVALEQHEYGRIATEVPD